MAWLAPGPARGDVKMGGAFGDHMVLQRDRELRIFVTTPQAKLEGPLDLRNATLFVDGKPLANEASCTGEIVYFYVPGKGRFLLSRRPRAGFVQGARLRLHALELSVNGVEYSWMSDDAIAKVPSLGPRKSETIPEMLLAMRYEADWKPAEPLLPASNAYAAGVVDPAGFPPTPARDRVAHPRASSFSINLTVVPAGEYFCDALISDPTTGEILQTPSLRLVKGGSSLFSKLTITMGDGKVGEVQLAISTDPDTNYATYSAKVVQGGTLMHSQRVSFPLTAL